MIEFSNGGKLVEDAAELPHIRASRVFADLETTSGHPRLDALNPWHHSRVAGIAITTDDSPGSWYVPVGHHDGRNLPRDVVRAWAADVMAAADEWVNHNVKYDAHVLANDLGVMPPGRLVDTVTLAKIIDSDRGVRGGYGLKALSRTWLREDIDRYQESLAPYLDRNKDWGAIPTDITAEYACQDVLTGRRLYRYEDAQCPEDCRRVWDTETELTYVLFDMERAGMGVDPQQLRVAEMLNIARMLKLEEELERIVGRSFRPHVSDDCFDVLCNQYGLPVMGRTEEGNPSFDKHAMAAYSAHPEAPQEVVSRIMDYRHLHTLNSFFVTKYQDLHIDGTLHPSYNQTVRTGRMSCRDPNAQQLSSDAKALIIPRPGNVICSSDYSQIEFRIIVHYIRDEPCIAAYTEDPDTDFHRWVADMIPMPRRPAKNVNFMMGYGGGRNKCVSMLAANKDVVGGLLDRVEELVAEGEIKPDQRKRAFDVLCGRKANAVYDKYHETLPGLRRTSGDAARVCQRRGYVKNLRGRRRHLPSDAAHRAFNTLCQSSAADIMKERTVALWKALRGTPIRIIGSVHDDTLTEGPRECFEDPRTLPAIASILEATDVTLRVPLRCSAGVSDANWLAASKASEPVAFDRNCPTGLDHLGAQ